MLNQRGIFATVCVVACVFGALAARATATEEEYREKRMSYGNRAEFAELWGKLGAELYGQDSFDAGEKGIALAMCVW